MNSNEGTFPGRTLIHASDEPQRREERRADRVERLSALLKPKLFAGCDQIQKPLQASSFHPASLNPRLRLCRSASIAPLRFIAHVRRPTPRIGSPTPAFTLLELLVVIAIIGILAALTAPVLNNFRPNYTASATAQLMDAISRGRQLAISQRTTVYMVFVPTNFWNDPAFNPLSPAEKIKAARLYDKQWVGYNYVTLRSMGDQPGQPTVRYLDSWRTLPEGAFVFPGKWILPRQSFLMLTNDLSRGPIPAFNVFGFNRSSSGLGTPAIPFPSEYAQPYVFRPGIEPYVSLPYLAFDYMGRLASGKDEIIPLSKGSVNFSRDVHKLPLQMLPSITEQPPGNATNPVTYNVVAVDWITGRARAIHQEVR
jgi:prepilin-type N-terminal cleavage/methylation domain-containing protein